MYNLKVSVRGLLYTMRLMLCRRGFLAASVVAMFMLVGAVTAGAEEENFPEKFMLRFGGYTVTNADTVARLDANSLPAGVYIGFADTLGGDTRANVGRLDGLYRFNDKHGIGLSWYALRFTGSKSLSRDITWNGVTYPVNAQVDSKLNFDVYKLNYQYSVYHNDKVELGASIGFHVMHVFMGITANNINHSEGQAVTAPLPVLGLFADYKFTPRFSAFYNYQVFNINYQDKVSGGLQDFLFGLEYRLFRNFALGAAYNRFAMNMKAKGDNATLYLETKWNGGMLYGSVYF